MMRWMALCLLAALPATAQDFRGLRPGMPAAALGPIGEPESIAHENGLILSLYPLPFEQNLEVLYDPDGGILWLTTFAREDAGRAPDAGGLRLREMTLSDVARRIGTNRRAMETDGLVAPEAGGTGFHLIYDLGDAPAADLLLLRFGIPGATYAADAPALEAPLPRDAVLTSAELMGRDFFNSGETDRSYLGGPRTAPIPFPIPLDEAFPSLIP